MKASKYILIVLIVAILAFSFLHKKKADDVVNVPMDSTELCYIWNTEAGDRASLRMDITRDGKVTGSFDWIPAEKDSKRGSIEGVAGPLERITMSRTADLWWTASAEGTTNTEQLIVKFGEGTAYPGFGEMKDRGDGTYVYADPGAITYSLALQDTDCNDSTR